LSTYLREELAWALAHADQRYAVLNACRAEAYAAEGLLLSKIGGGHWWATGHGPEPLVQEALTAQAAGRDLGSCRRPAREFIDRACCTLARP
jgi:streptomycin 3"-adenylyltransferase